MAIKNIVASVLERIRNESLKEGISYQIALQLFFEEEFLRKLSMSEYNRNFILKGGMFIYTLTDYDSRITRDMDFMMRKLSNDMDKVRTLMDSICQIDTGHDYIQMKVVDTKKITVTHKYPGVTTKFLGIMGNVKVPFSVDVGIDDVIWPEPVFRIVKPRLPDFNSITVLTYSLESTIAEKFSAILEKTEITDVCQ